MGSRVEIIRQGKVEAYSRNLRGILDYARRNSVRRVKVEFGNITRRAFYTVEFFNGATCKGEFAEYGICVDWFKSRRSWDLNLTLDNGEVARFEAKE